MGFLILFYTNLVLWDIEHTAEQKLLDFPDQILSSNISYVKTVKT